VAILLAVLVLLLRAALVPLVALVVVLVERPLQAFEAEIAQPLVAGHGGKRVQVVPEQLEAERISSASWSGSTNTGYLMARHVADGCNNPPPLRGHVAGGCNTSPPAALVALVLALRGRPPLRCNNPPPAAPEAPLARPQPQPHPLATLAKNFVPEQSLQPGWPAARLRAMAGIRSKRHAKAALVAMVAACS